VKSLMGKKKTNLAWYLNSTSCVNDGFSVMSNGMKKCELKMAFLNTSSTPYVAVAMVAWVAKIAVTNRNEKKNP
jgi:hypothetical protein